MKKIIVLLASLFTLFVFAACDLSALLGQQPLPQGSVSSSTDETSDFEEESSSNQEEEESDSQDQVERHPHNLKRVAARSAKCDKEGNILHWYCETCEKYFADTNGAKEIAYEDIVIPTTAHLPVEMPGREPTCAVVGKYTYYVCSMCANTFSDEECTKPCNKDDMVIDTLPHDLTHTAGVPAEGKVNGIREHWTCSICENAYADENGEQYLTPEQTIWYANANLVDFLVTVEDVDRDPVVLQLTDTQIIDSSQTRPGRPGVAVNLWAPDKMDVRCFNYLRETIEATNPDLILLTGDNIYGEFDDNGSVWLKLVAFMDSFEIPWAPIFGNHDNESKMGVDWQCEQLKNAKYCLFEQRELSGNGNYSVGLEQGGELKRVFYMLDTNGCGNASAESLANGHTFNDFVGFMPDQIAWYTNAITLIKSQLPETKISFAYHIQSAIFADAYGKYGFDSNNTKQDINVDLMPDKAEGDFGYIGRDLKGEWDKNYAVFNGMKELGVDSIFVGHEHCNSASVVYEGIRFQFGQKSSEYDRFNSINTNGKVIGQDSVPAGATPLMGGTVMILSKEDGSIKDAYIYYCDDAGDMITDGQINWSQFIDYPVNGLQKGTDLTTESSVALRSVQFDDTVNAYEAIASTQGKVFVNPELLKGKQSVTFTIFVPAGSKIINTWGAFALRFKVSEDNGAILNLPGTYSDATNKYYQIYKISETNEALQIKEGEWVTYTIDISGFADTCTEFAILIAAGNTLYLRDVAVA